jgi:hypothetical protein
VYFKLSNSKYDFLFPKGVDGEKPLKNLPTELRILLFKVSSISNLNLLSELDVLKACKKQKNSIVENLIPTKLNLS